MMNPQPATDLLHLEEQRYRSLGEATTALVWTTPASGEFETEQRRWSAFTGQSFTQLKGWGWLDAVVGRLRQIIVNLVGNALKFTDSGEVVVRVTPGERTTDGLELHFAIADTGIGIPTDKLRAIFEPFAQADSSTTRRYGGTGLGLTISCRLASLMAGRLWAESTPGKGSIFHFTARLARVAHLAWSA